MLRRFVSLLVVAAAATSLPAAAQAEDSIASQIGGLIAMRDETIGIMNYCYQNIAQDQAYIEARDAWYLRNGEDIQLIDAGLAKVGGVTDEEKKAIDKTISDQVKKDVTDQPDPAAFCKLFADRLKSTAQDLSVFAPSSPLLKNVRDWLKTQ